MSISHIFFLHFAVAEHFDCFRILTVVTNAAVNVGVQTSPADTYFNPFDGSNSFLRNRHTVLYNGCTISHSHQ